MPEHGGGGLRLVDDAERHVGLGQAHQRLLDMARRLVLGDHHLEAVDRRDVFAPLLIVARGVHFLAGELVARHLELALGRRGVFGVGIFAHHLVERLHRALGALLVARDVGDLVEIGRADQVLRIGGVRAARMQGHVALRRRDRVVVLGALVVRVGRHDQRLARPFRIGVLAVDFLEALGGRLVVLLVVQKVQALIVELVGRIVRDDVLLAEKAACRQRRDHEGERAQPCGLPPTADRAWPRASASTKYDPLTLTPSPAFSNANKAVSPRQYGDSRAFGRECGVRSVNAAGRLRTGRRGRPEATRPRSGRHGRASAGRGPRPSPRPPSRRSDR